MCQLLSTLPSLPEPEALLAALFVDRGHPLPSPVDLCLWVYSLLFKVLQYLESFFTCRTKALFTLVSRSLSVSKRLYAVILRPALLSLVKAVTRWWSLPTSASLFILTSSSERFHTPLIIKWSIWFSSLPLDERHVNLWMSWCGKRVPPMTRLFMLQS